MTAEQETPPAGQGSGDSQDYSKKNTTTKKAEAKSIVEALEPHSKPVAPGELFESIISTLKRYVILPDAAYVIISLWIMGTYVFNAFHIFPLLAAISPEKRCGKSTLLDLLDALCCRAVFASNISPAAVFRFIEKEQPTLIIDEADTFMGDKNNELTGIINSGHAKTRAFVIRSVGEKHEPQRFSTWAPKAIASIKRLPDTIMDRSIVIEMRRKTINEKTERLPGTLSNDCLLIRQKAQRWADDNREHLSENLIVPDYLGNDRAVDNYLPLMSIANAVSPACLQSCKDSYLKLNKCDDELSIQIELLLDIREIYEETGRDFISSESMVNYLVEMQERPWCEWKNGNPMTINSLAKLLKGFNIKSKQVRHGDIRYRGYEREKFKDSFNRYLPTGLNRDTVTMASNKAISDSEPVTTRNSVTDKKPLKPAPDNDCHGVTGEKGEREVFAL